MTCDFICFFLTLNTSLPLCSYISYYEIVVLRIGKMVLHCSSVLPADIVELSTRRSTGNWYYDSTYGI